MVSSGTLDLYGYGPISREDIMEADLDKLKEFLGTYHTPEELVAILEISTEELLELFEDKVLEHSYKYEEDIE